MVPCWSSTVGVLVCFLDLGSACWTQAVYTAGLFAHYGSAAMAGAWTGGVAATRDAIQTFPDLTTVNQPSTDPAPRPLEVPVLPDLGSGDDSNCRVGATNAKAILERGLNPGLETKIREQHGPPETKADGKGHFNEVTMNQLRALLIAALSGGVAQRNFSGESECQLTAQFDFNIGRALTPPAGRGWRYVNSQTIMIKYNTSGWISTAYPFPNNQMLGPFSLW